MAVTPRLMTADELACLPDDAMRHELVRGELRTMAPPFYPHGRSSTKIGRSLDRHVETHRLGEVHTSEIGYRLTTNPDTVRVPDVAFLSIERLGAAGDVTGYFPGSPALVVEVISQNDLHTEVDEKVAEWLEHGTRLVFVVNPRRRTVAVHRPGQTMSTLTMDDTLSGEDVVPGWSMAVHALFEQV